MKLIKKILFIFVVATLFTLVACKTPDNNNNNNNNEVPVTEYTITFENTMLSSIKVKDGNKLEKPVDPIKDGYEFKGWYTSSDYSSEFDFNSEIKANTKLYALYYVSILKAQSIARALEHNEVSATKYFITGTIKSIDNSEYGNMWITDGSNDIYVYGVFAWGGEDKYNTLNPRPVIGDTVVVYGVFKKFNESIEVNNSWLYKMEKGELPEFNAEDYTEMTTIEAKSSAIQTKVIVEGVVTTITYATGKRANGFFLIDEVGAIYIHDYDVAASVNEGDLIRVAGQRANFILESEIGFAEQLGYQGAIQLDKAILIKNKSSNNNYSTSWIQEASIKDLVEANPKTTNITGNIYKVNAFINKAPGLGFTNYYFNDLDNKTGSYVYSMNNGSDFSWLDAYDGELRTVYLAVLNAKSTVSNLTYRFVPIAILDTYNYDQNFNAEYAVKFFAKEQFMKTYFASPDLEMITKVDAPHLSFNNVTVSYSSSNEAVLYFEEVAGKLYLKTNTVKSDQTVTVTITAEHGSNTFTDTVEIAVKLALDFETITVKAASTLEEGTEVIVEGIVTASLVNKVGFYISDDTGIIAVSMQQAQMEGIRLGHKVIIKGIRSYIGKTYDKENPTVLLAIGQNAIANAELIYNKYGSHEYNTSFYKTDKTLVDLVGLDKTIDYSTTVYVFEAVVLYEVSSFYTRYSLKDPNSNTTILIYSSSASQLRFLQPVQNKQVSVEFTLVNWNGKAWSGSVLSVTYEGQKYINDSNFR